MKHYFWILAIALLALTACHRESVTPDLHVAEMIIGKWMKSDQNGQPLPTNQKMVYTFVSPTKAIMSASIDARPEVGTHWVDQLEADVTISGNKVSLTSYSEEGATMVVDYNITSIAGNTGRTAPIPITLRKTTTGNPSHTRSTSTSWTGTSSAPAG